MRSRVLAVAAVLLATTACLDSLTPPNGRLGVIYLDAYESGPDYVLKPTGYFFEQTVSAFTTGNLDTCFVALPPAINQPIPQNTMSVGDQITLLHDGGSEVLDIEDLGGFFWYESGLASGFAFTPGDTIDVSIPGNGGNYPPVNLSVRTAETFTHGAVPVPAEGVNIDLTWDAAPEPGSAMQFNLLYATPASQTGTYNQQVYCRLVDDGSHTIGAPLLNGWRTAFNDLREARAERLRYNVLDVDSRTKVVLLSTFMVPTPTPP
jgi:hypothetical protein